MIEYIRFEYTEFFGKNILLELKLSEASFEYKLHGATCIEGTVNDIGDFVQNVKKLDIPKLQDNYRNDGPVMDGMSFNLQYKESGAANKTIEGEYFPAEITKLLSEIERLIPEARFFGEVDFDEWLGEVLDDSESERIDESFIANLRADFDAAPTWAKKHLLLENALYIIDDYRNENNA